MKVLLVLEDPTHDEHIAKRIVERLLQDARVQGRVSVLHDPHLRGAAQALDQTTIAKVVEANPMEDAFILIVDRDCNRQQHVEKATAREAEHQGKLLACLAVEEVEVWLLALYNDRIKEPWKAVREDCDPKERWAEPLLKSLGTDGPGGGRKNAMRALSGNFKSLLSRCPELGDLRDRLKQAVELRAGVGGPMREHSGS